MKTNHDIKRMTQVLRDTSIHANPHVLERPKRAGEMRFPTAQAIRAEPALKELFTQATAGLPHLSPPTKLVIDRYPEGFQAGKKEGVVIGHEEAKSEYEAKMLAEREGIFEKAYQEGLLKANLDAEEKFKTEIDRLKAQFAHAFTEQTSRFDALLSANAQEFKGVFAAVEEDMIQICFTSICKILGEKAVTRDVIVSMIQKCTQDHVKDALQIGLHPKDLEMLRADVTNGQMRGVAAALELSTAADVTLLADADVKMGGMVLRTGNLSLDARLELQVDLLKSTLLQARNRKSTADEADS